MGHTIDDCQFLKEVHQLKSGIATLRPENLVADVGEEGGLQQGSEGLAERSQLAGDFSCLVYGS